MSNLGTIILAAGKGTRMKSLKPKVLHDICGKPMISYVLEAVKTAGSHKTCVVLGHQNEAVRDFLGAQTPSVLQEKMLGTADAVKAAASHFKGHKGNILIVCGDTPLLQASTLNDLIRRHKKSEAACSFLTAVVHEPQGYGRIIRGPDGAAVAIREEKDATEYEKNIAEINVGLYCVRAKVLFDVIKKISVNRKKKEYYLTDMIALLAQQGAKIETLETEDAQEGLGVNTREDLAVAIQCIQQRTLRELMLSGVTIEDPCTTVVHANVRIGRDTVIRPFSVIEQGVVIGSECVIGPFARLRPGTKVKDRAIIGNFAEVSRSQMGKGSIMKHFGFLGDTQVGAQANIGAGVVTANYDGVNKNKTLIADGAFIGSDSILIAPVKIGTKGVTGAGTVVTKNTVVGSGEVCVGVPGRVRRKDSKTKNVKGKRP